MIRDIVALACVSFLLAFALAPAGAAAEPEPGPAGWMYEPGAVVVIDLSLLPAEKAALEANPDEYVKGTFALSKTDGTPTGVEPPLGPPVPVEIRLKGGLAGSFRTLDAKAAFKLKFKKTEPFFGLRKMTLNNMVEDFSLIHETLAYTAFRAAGIAASRTGFADVRLNGEDFGLHLNIENLDKVNLERWFGPFADPQHLYEGESGADVVPGGAGEYEVDEGDEENREDLESLIAAVNGIEGEGWSAQVAPVADLAEMTRMWAVEKYVGHWDSYSGREDPNNYYLYSDPSGVFQMLPWGTDETFVRRLAFDSPGGLMFNRCLVDPECERLYRRELRAAGKLIAGLDLGALGQRTADLLGPWEEEDPRLEHPDLVDRAVAEALAFVAARPAELADWLGPEGAEAPPAPAAGGFSASEPPVPSLGQRLLLRGSAVAAGVLKTQVRISVAGEVNQVATIHTASGEIRVCSAQASTQAAADLTLRCVLSEATRRRLQRRWLNFYVTTRFTPGEGDSEVISRRLHVRRAPIG